MDGSLNEAERPAQSPVTASQARPVTLSVVIDGRLDAVRARQVATLTDRLGLAGVWLRHPWWPLSGAGTVETDRAGLLRSLTALASGAQAPPGLIVDADAAAPGDADDAWLDRLVQAASPRIAIAGAPPAITRWQGLIGRRPELTRAQLAVPAREGAAP